MGRVAPPESSAARAAEKKRIAYAEGEEERVLRAVRVVVDEQLARPILIGRPAVIEQRIERFGLRLVRDVDYEVVNPEFDERYREFWQTYRALAERRGVTEQIAKVEMRRRHTLIAAMMVYKNLADGMICGTWGRFTSHLETIDQVLGHGNASVYGAMNGLILPGRQVFLIDTHVNYDPSAAELAELTVMAAEKLQRFGLTPKAALLSHSNFGSSFWPSAQKMREVLPLLRARAPWLDVDGEMHGDCALDADLRAALLPGSTLVGEANLLVLPHIDAANISYNLLKTAAGGGIAIGPMLLGVARPVCILTASSTVRRLVNMTALTVADANTERPA